MKRIGLSIAFFIVGLLTMWAAMVAGSHMSFRFSPNWAKSSSGCHEIGPCSVPWWITVLLIAYLLGPSLIFAMTGWSSARPGVPTRKRFGRLLALMAITALLYLVGYAIGG